MASKPGLLTDWPWKQLGSFKYVILAPWVVRSMYLFSLKGGGERDLISFLTLPFLLWRMLHNQIWISLSRHRTAKGNNRIVDKSIEFEQVDRESNWDDQILFNGIITYIASMAIPGTSNMPIWRRDGLIITTLLHIGPVEYLYYWLHRALHHHYLYSRYHSHHHSSIVTEPITSVIHPFAEHIAYFLLFAIPIFTTIATGTASVLAIFGYITYIDLMNNMGHCNFELIPMKIFSIFPPLKYMMYTPSYHSLHHTQFRTNYSLFMPIYDYIYGTMDKSTDVLFETSLRRQEESPNVVHLTHLTTPDSIYHLRLGFSSLASEPQDSKWYLWLMWPVTYWSMIMAAIYGRTFILDRNAFGEKLKLQSWAVPRYSVQYFFKWPREAINGLIEEAILEAEARGIKGQELNRNGEIYIQRYPQLNVKVVDGSSLAVGVVLNSIPKGTTQVLLRGRLSKVAYSIASALCQMGIGVATLYEDEYEKLKLTTNSQSSLLLSRTYALKTWLVGDGLTEEEQLKASKGTLFIPFSQFPPKKIRHDCFYQYTPAMGTPISLENMHSCENWLPRRVMSAWRIAGIVHALEGWNVHECGNKVFDIDKVWEASLKHGFKPLVLAS
ncbi:unnamed protein product [Ilex paraguariensis]|uniref:Protein ECERIFERUM 1-like n=1 Tax=Ilex paraguariensis TaxID=185542 RepID=A0ABC8R3E7_9AQUA